MKRGPETYSSESVPRQRSSRRKVDDPRGEDTGTPSSGAVPSSPSWATRARSVGSWGSRDCCSIDGRSGWLNTGQRGCIRAGGGAGAGGRRSSRLTRSRPSWAWPCPGRRGVRGGCRRSWLAARFTSLPAPFTGCFGVWGLGRGMSGWLFSSTTAPDPLGFSPSALADASGRLVTAVPATSKPSSPAIWSAWTASTSASSRASERSGRSRPAMRPAPSPSPRSSRRWRRSTALGSSSASCFRPSPIERPAGSSSVSSQTTEASSKASSTPSALSSASTTRGPSLVIAGPMASSSGFREPSSTSTGESPSGVATSRRQPPSIAPSRTSWPSTTTSDLIRDTDSKAGLQPISSSVRYSEKPISRTRKVSTPFRSRTI